MWHILHNKGQGAFKALVNKLVEEHGLKIKSINDIHVSADFQCDVTDGFPTVLCVDWDEGYAFLEPAPLGGLQTDAAFPPAIRCRS